MEPDTNSRGVRKAHTCNRDPSRFTTEAFLPTQSKLSHSTGYTVERQGALNYPNLVKFLYSVNIHYRHTLPGNSMADDEEWAELEKYHLGKIVVLLTF